MWMVVIEHDDDGTWYDGPFGFENREDARNYGRVLSPPTNNSVVIYNCHFEERFSPDVKESTSPEGSSSGNGFN